VAEQKVLIISQVFYPDEVAVANLFTNLSSVLVKSGLEIEVWSAQPFYTCTKPQPRIRFYEGMRIHYLHSTQFPKDKFTGRIINYFTFAISVIFKLLFSKDKTQVISHTTPPFLAIIISLICSFKNRKFIYILMDIFPDGLIRLGKASGKNIFIRIWQSIHRAALKRSEYIVVIGRDMRDWLVRFYPEGAEKTRYIPVWQDEELIKPVDIKLNPFIVKYQLQDYFVVQYSGNMGLWNDMKTIGQAINKNITDVVFLIIGGGMRKKELLESINDKNATNILFLPFQTNENYSYSVTACHVALVSLREGLEGMAVPSKIIGIMAAGIPVIAMVPDHSEIAYIVEEEKCGYIINPSDTEGLVNAITELKSDENLRKRLGQNGRDAFLRKYTTEIVAEKFNSLLNN
jgi:glycosyltransferase involved in cell wall biosynthesis